MVAALVLMHSTSECLRELMSIGGTARSGTSQGRVGGVSHVSVHAARQGDSGSFADRPEGIAHDRWDVLLRSSAGDVMVECGSVRERISQELARAVFDAVRTDMERRDAALPAQQPDDLATTPVR